jgi:hypothetical protein
MGDLPERVSIPRGQEQVVRLPSSAGAGYRWQASVDDEAIVGAEVRFERSVRRACIACNGVAGRKTCCRSPTTRWQ